jgi:DNA-binding MarR family transcriptional regulator
MLKVLKSCPSLQHSFTFLLRTCSLITEKRGLAAVPEFENARESFILGVLACDPLSQLTQLELAKRLGISPNVMVRIIDRMEQRELVKRERREDMRQANYLEIMPKGKKLADAWKIDILDNPAIVAPLTLREREQLRQLLIKLSSAMTL